MAHWRISGVWGGGGGFLFFLQNFCRIPQISTLRGDICGQWSFSTRSTLTYLDVLPHVYLFLSGGNFTSRGKYKYVQWSLPWWALLVCTNEGRIIKCEIPSIMIFCIGSIYIA